MKYAHEYAMGKRAADESSCPFPASQIGKRCAWLAGFYDSRATWAVIQRQQRMDRGIRA